VPAERRVVRNRGFVAHELGIELEEGSPVTVEKVAALVTSRDAAIYEPGLTSKEHVPRAGGFDELLERHVLAWDQLWQRFDMRIEDSQRSR
jgi:trehalose/maltose hydrolase-like predicted phosphorylase